jgi:hypothetical protein
MYDYRSKREHLGSGKIPVLLSSSKRRYVTADCKDSDKIGVADDVMSYVQSKIRCSRTLASYLKSKINPPNCIMNILKKEILVLYISMRS